MKLIGRQLPYPVPTRWSTDHKCISELLKEEAKSPGMLKQLLAASATEKRTYTDFTEHELAYLKEYAELTSPIANGIDRLQGDKNTFFGDLLPTLFSVKAKLERLKGLKILGKAAELLLNSLVGQRFKKEFKLDENAKMAICAAISHPQYKSRWGSVEDSEKAMVIFMREYEEMSIAIAPQTAAANTEGESTSDFLQLRETPLSPGSSEVVRYLANSRTDFEMLNDYPVIREIFFKNNTQLPTSASVERMFNFAGILDNPKRGRILPSNFENNVVLKANSAFSQQK